jgi:hypothetical protein
MYSLSKRQPWAVCWKEYRLLWKGFFHPTLFFASNLVLLYLIYSKLVCLPAAGTKVESSRTEQKTDLPQLPVATTLENL